jgi:putative oxidoreductase
MDKFDRYAGPAYCIMRVVMGMLFACHGGTKILAFPASQYGPTQTTLGFVSGWIELICGFLIALGLFTRIAAFFASGEMAVAYFVFSAPKGFFPIANGGELAVTYCFLFFFTSFYGAGHWSIDSVLKQKKAAARATP